MIALEGRVLAGLDEFMLRIGHLKVLAGVAIDVGGNWSRVEREFARYITQPCPVSEADLPHVTTYIAQKRLCPAAGETDTSEDRGKYRYPQFILEDFGGKQRLSSTEGSVRIWRQDLWMASPEVKSKVGAVTVSAKSGSKTGVSHVRDWATLIDLFSTAGQLAAEGHMAIKLENLAHGETWHVNPYVIGLERLVFGFLILGADIDLLARFAPRLLSATFPLRRADATAVFSDALEALNEDAENTRALSSAKQYRLLQQLREIQGHQRGASAKASTTWHRAASRLETYVDLGLLDKGRGGEAERYEYTYYGTPALKRCVESLERASSSDEWIEDSLAAAVLDQETSSAPLSPDDVEPLLRKIAPCLGRPVSLLPITALAIGVSWLTARQGRPISIRAARASLEEFAKTKPELGRLSRGGSGSRAEFISLLMKLERS